MIHSRDCMCSNCEPDQATTGEAQSECNGLLCDRDCNHCPIILHDNSRLLTKIFNEAFNTFGDDFYSIVQKHCPNMTCCADCHIDDFCHLKNAN